MRAEHPFPSPCLLAMPHSLTEKWKVFSGSTGHVWSVLMAELVSTSSWLLHATRVKMSSLMALPRPAGRQGLLVPSSQAILLSANSLALITSRAKLDDLQSRDYFGWDRITVENHHFLAMLLHAAPSCLWTEQCWAGCFCWAGAWV